MPTQTTTTSTIVRNTQNTRNARSIPGIAFGTHIPPHATLKTSKHNSDNTAEDDLQGSMDGIPGDEDFGNGNSGNGDPSDPGDPDDNPPDNEGPDNPHNNPDNSKHSDTHAFTLGAKSDDNCPSEHLYITPNLSNLLLY